MVPAEFTQEQADQEGTKGKGTKATSFKRQ
jgi:hypothetical protein